jgi:EpsI family protein
MSMTLTMRARVIVVLLVLAATSVAVARAYRTEEVPPRLSFALLPMQLGTWIGMPNPPLTEKVLDVLKLDDYVGRLYQIPNGPMADLYVGYWKSQRQGGAIHSPQNCLPGAGWEPVSQRTLTIPDPRNPSAEPIGLNRFVIQKGLDKQLVLYWYQSRGRVVGSEYWSKLYLILDAARYNRTDAALVRVVVPVRDTTAEAEAAAEQHALDFVNVLLPALGAHLPN